MRRDGATARANLRAVIEALPRHTRVAMLKGIERNEIIAGAYSNGEGVCPMLAAHRAGGRTTAIAFAKAWDRFAFRNVHRRRPRRATERELLILKLYLQASLLATPAEHVERSEPSRRAAPLLRGSRVTSSRADEYGRLIALLESELAAAADCDGELALSH
jgi:hypothetical protein